MSTSAPAVIDTSAPAIPLGRLVRVEWRKMTDTRAGRWLIIVTAALLALTIFFMELAVALNDSFEPTANAFAGVLQFVVLLIAPVFAIMITTSEWSQRSHLFTFSLEPRRPRILAAKFLAVLIFAAVTVAVSIALGLLGNELTALFGRDVTWDFGVGDILWSVGLQLSLILSAFALGLLFLNSTVAIAVFYVLSIMLRFIIWPILFGFFHWAQELAPWLDLFFGFGVASEGKNFDNETVTGVVRYGPIFTGLLVFFVIPGVIGYLRALKSEVK